jgi:hypothetical protein
VPYLEFHPKSRVRPESAFLLEFARDVHSQRGEDGVIDKLFELLGARTRWCVDVGAFDGAFLSNTRALMEQGWSGVLIEGHDKNFAKLRDLYRGQPGAHPVHAMVGFDPGGDSLDYLLARTPLPREFDLLSIDIDGNDWHVWDSLTQYRPRIVVIEFNPSIPNDVAFVQDRDPNQRRGASLLALADLARKKGYELAAAMDWNGFFVVCEEFPALGIADNSIDAIYHDRFTNRIFHGYDGTLFLAGNPRTLWGNQPILERPQFPRLRRRLSRLWHRALSHLRPAGARAAD